MAAGVAAAILLSCVCGILSVSGVSSYPQAPANGTDHPHPDPNITFYMYPTAADAEGLNTDDIDALQEARPLTMVVHGFKGDSTAKSMETIKQALLLRDAPNVVVVDWGPLADERHDNALGAYHHVRDHGVPRAAAEIARWLKRVIIQRRISPDRVHLIGFSLGGHVVGIVGALLNSTIGRITGLDPPKFGYELVSAAHRLTSDDARFVNVIHTTGGVLSYSEPIGHVDYFPNGDLLPQRGCPEDGPIDLITCSHYMAFALLAETIINPRALVATECDNWQAYVKGKCEMRHQAPMGYATPNTTRGQYFSNTRDEPPYGHVDPKHRIPEEILLMLRYDKGDSIVNAADMVGFLTNKESLESGKGSETSQGPSPKGVMRVKSARGSGTSTTTGPPPFQDASAAAMSLPTPASLAIVLVMAALRVIIR